MIKNLGKDLVAKYYSFYFSWGFYFSAGLLAYTKKYKSLPIMG